MEEVTSTEQILLEFAYSNFDVFVKVNHIIKPEYFEPELQRVVNFVNKYYNEYKSLPNIDIVSAECGVELFQRKSSEKADKEYAVDKIAAICKTAAFRAAVLDGAEMVNEQEDDDNPDFSAAEKIIREALMVSVDRDIGVEQFLDPIERLKAMQQKLDQRSIGWQSLDFVIDYIRRGEMTIFAANSGGGKSLVLGNIARNLVMDGLNCVYISLELDEALLTKRFDAMFTGFSYKDIFNHCSEIDEMYKNMAKSGIGSLVTKKLPVKSTASNIRSYLLEYQLTYGRSPDAILVDYLDIMGPNDGGKNKGRFDIDKDIAEELRDVFVDFNAYGFTASQLNRDSVDVSVKSQSHIAGGMSKINTADTALAISRTEEQIDNGEIEFQPLKLRNAEMKTTPTTLYLDSKTLQITEKRGGIKAKVKGTGNGADRLNKLLGKKQ